MNIIPGLIFVQRTFLWAYFRGELGVLSNFENGGFSFGGDYIRNSTVNVICTRKIRDINVRIAAGRAGCTQEAQYRTILSTGNPTLRIARARALYHREPIKKRRQYHFIELFSCLKSNGWAACASLMSWYVVIKVKVNTCQCLLDTKKQKKTKQ